MTEEANRIQGMLDEFNARTEAVQRDTIVIYQQMGDVRLTDILTNEFMEANTNFHSFRELTFSSMVWIDWSHDVVHTRRSLLDQFIAGSTRFKTWDEFYGKAEAEYTARTGKVLVRNG